MVTEKTGCSGKLLRHKQRLPYTGRTSGFGLGCVKTTKLEIFMGRVTLPDPEKIA